MLYENAFMLPASINGRRFISREKYFHFYKENYSNHKLLLTISRLLPKTTWRWNLPKITNITFFDSVITYRERRKRANLVAVAPYGLSDVAGLDGITVRLDPTGCRALQQEKKIKIEKGTQVVIKSETHNEISVNGNVRWQAVIGHLMPSFRFPSVSRD